MFSLPENLSIHNVKEIQEELLSHFRKVSEGPDKVAELDFSGVRDLDAAGIQLILSVCKTFSHAGMEIKLTGMTPFVQHLLDLSGSSDILEIRR